MEKTEKTIIQAGQTVLLNIHKTIIGKFFLNKCIVWNVFGNCITHATTLLGKLILPT